MGHSFSHQEQSSPLVIPTPETIPDGHPFGTSIPPTAYLDTLTAYLDTLTTYLDTSTSYNYMDTSSTYVDTTTAMDTTTSMDSTTSSSVVSTSTPSYSDDCTTRSCLYFTFNKESTLLFENWRVESDFEFWMAMGGIVCLALLYEMV